METRADKPESIKLAPGMLAPGIISTEIAPLMAEPG